MPTIQFKNNASTTLAASISNSVTTITVTNASTFPVLTGSDSFYATMYEVAASVETNIEIVKVTATAGTSWTIVRAQDGTTARARDPGVAACYIELRLTAAGALSFLQKENNLSEITTPATARTNLGLGTMATQNASAVAITGGTISGVTIASVDSTTTIQDNADSTKKVAFEVSGVTTATTRTLTIPNASGTIALTSDLTAGYQPLDSDLTALAALAANGLIARTGTGTVSVRTMAAPAAGFTITNPDGVSGNPTFVLANDLAGVEGIGTTGFVRRTAADTWSASAIVDGDLPAALTGKTYNAITPTALATGFSLAGGTTSKTLTVSNSITLAGTDGTTITLPASSGTLPLNNQTMYIGTTAVAINRASAALVLTGITSIDGNAATATSATSATTATNLTGGALGSLHYQSAASTSAVLAPNTTTTKLFLSQTGTGTIGAIPAWSAVAKADVGLANVENTALSTWTGAATITTVGTVTAGTWNATTISIAKGGTGATTAIAAFDALSPATTLGDLIYHDGADNVRLAGHTVAARRFLRQTGTGTVSAAPAWDSLTDPDIPAALTGKTYNSLTLTAASVGFTLAGGTTSKTLTVSNTLALAGTDASTLNIGTGGTLGSAAFTASTAYAPAAGSASITTLGTISSGTWQGSAVGIAYGGTGTTTKAGGFNALSPVTTLGDLIYGDGANSSARLAGNTSATKMFLSQTGTGTVSAAPAWGALVNADIPATLTGKTYNGLSLTANTTGFQIAGGTTAKTLVVSNNLTLAGTDGSTLNIGAGGTLGSAAFTASSAYAAAAGAATIATVGTITTGVWNGTVVGLAYGGTGAADATQARTNLGLAIGTNVQAYDADLAAIAALAGTTGLLKKTAADTWTLDTTSYQTTAGMSSYAPLASPALTGTPTSTTAAADTNTTQIATTAFVLGQASASAPLVNGTAAVGTATRWARGDHVHPTDTTRAPLASPTFTGTLTAAALTTTGAITAGTAAWTVGTTQLIKDASGNVGIGGTPVGKLHVYGNLMVQGAATPTSNHGYFLSNTSATLDYGFGLIHVNNAVIDASISLGGNPATSSTGLIIFATNAAGSSAVERMRIDASGNSRFSGSASTAPVAVAFSATAMSLNCASSNVFTTTFTANVTTAPTISNPVDGQTINWFITQDATGSRTMTWPATFKWPGGTAGVLSTAANAVDLLVATYRGTSWYATLAKGFA
jgi:trimeric autotransporter adhesin